MGVFRHMNGDRLLRDSCSWYARSSAAESNSDVTVTYAAAVTLRCFVGQPSSKWLTRWPEIDLSASLEIWLPHSATVGPRDKITYGGQDYIVQEVADWQGAAFSALMRRHTGVQA